MPVEISISKAFENLAHFQLIKKKKKTFIVTNSFQCLNFKKGQNYEWEWRFYHILNITKSVLP